MMNEAKFTPGPWALACQQPTTLSGYGPDYLYEIVSPDKCPMNEGDSWQVAVIYGSDVEEDQCEQDRIVRELGLANARLIAAAPDMYDMLKTIENDDGSVPGWLWDRIQATLAKARGETNE